MGGFLPAAIVGGSFLQGLFNQWSTEDTNFTNMYINQQNQDFAEKENQKNRDFQTSERLGQQQWQTQMYERYNSVGAMLKQMTDAGINPATLGNQVGQLATPFSGNSSAGTGSSVTPSPIPMQAPQFNFSADIADAVSKLADAKKKGAETTRIETLLNSDLESIMLDNNNKALHGQMVAIQNEILDATKNPKIQQAFADYQSAVADVILKGEEFDIKQQQKALNHLDALLKDDVHGLNGLKMQEIRIRLGNLDSWLKSQIASNYGVARSANSVADLNENQLHILSTPDVRKALAQDIIESVHLKENAGLLSEKQMTLVENQARLLEKEISVYRARAIVGMINESLNTVVNAAGQFTRVGMLKQVMDIRSNTASPIQTHTPYNPVDPPNLLAPWQR